MKELHFNRINLEGKRFGRLTVLSIGDNKGTRKHTTWNCLCACGKYKNVLTASLLRGVTKSCGCLVGDVMVNRLFEDLTGETFGRLKVLRMGRIVTSARKTAFRKQKRKNYWVCQCECGNVKELSKDTLKQGSTKSCGCIRKEHGRSMVGEGHPSWNGGRYKSHGGYVIVNCGPGIRRSEHALVMESKLGRPLISGETVHHINGIKDDNRPENLELWASNHCAGQRVHELVSWAKQLLETYEPSALKAKHENA